jgi:hypothetical protein
MNGVDQDKLTKALKAIAESSLKWNFARLTDQGDPISHETRTEVYDQHYLKGHTVGMVDRRLNCRTCERTW